MGEFGSRFKQLRLEKALSLREFCFQNGIDASNLSKMERGVLPPPSGDKLEHYLSALGLEKGSEKRYDFHDLASAERGQIPEDIADDEFINKRMPVFFRAARETKGIDDGNEIVEKLRDIIKKAWTP